MNEFEYWRDDTGKGESEVLGDTPVPVALCPPHGLTCT